MSMPDYLSPADLKNLFSSSGFAIRKKWGQNFLIDPNLIRKITAIILDGGEGPILEIGPGPGTLTALLLHSGRTIHAAEIDPFLCDFLGERFVESDNFVLHRIDGRKLLAQANRTGSDVRVECICGNLPYYITTELLIDSCAVPEIRRGVFLVQREYAMRVVRTEAESSLTVYLQNLGRWEIALHLPPTVFYPRPNVHSSLLIFEPHLVPRSNPEILEKILRMSFRGKRKKIKNSWTIDAELLPVDSLLRAAHEIGIDPEVRPEQIAIDAYFALALYVEKLITSQETGSPNS